MDFLTSLKLNAIPSSHAFRLRGRASRSEFWWFYLGIILITIPASIGIQVLTQTAPLLALPLSVVFTAYFLYLHIAYFTCSVRRLHDRNLSGWNMLWILLPLFGAIYLLVNYILPGTEGENRFGNPE